LSTGLLTAMKVKQEQLDRLAAALLKAYQQKDVIALKRSEAEVKSAIVGIVSRNFSEEEAIEDEARKMLAAYGRAAKDMDPYKMFLIAKQKLAEKRGFVL
jgi:hypothetical protein